MHLGYRNVEGLRVWHVTGQDRKEILATRKRQIQDGMRERLGLLADIPKSGGAGTTNDGNSARRAFSLSSQETFAELLGLELWLIRDLHIILCVISSGLPIDSNKFDGLPNGTWRLIRGSTGLSHCTKSSCTALPSLGAPPCLWGCLVSRLENHGISYTATTGNSTPESPAE